MLKVCANPKCGKEFETDREDKLYCVRKCLRNHSNQRLYKLKPRPTLRTTICYCGQLFETTYPHQMFCSEKCERNNPRLKAYQRCHYHNNFNYYKQKGARNYKLNRTSRVLVRLKLEHRLKIEVLNYYGPNSELKCNFCPETRLDALTIDHIDGNGRTHRKTISRKGGVIFYRWLKIKGFPAGFRTLCMSCNHKQIRILRQSKLGVGCKHVNSRNYRARIKLKFFTHLGTQCECGQDDLDVLTVGHMNNDGHEHRKVIGSSVFYQRVLKTGDFAGLRTQCFSCNMADYRHVERLKTLTQLTSDNNIELQSLLSQFSMSV